MATIQRQNKNWVNSQVPQIIVNKAHFALQPLFNFFYKWLENTKTSTFKN